MRDVFITREPGNQGFRMVWTWGWRGHSLGTASSEDLMTWTPQEEVPIMQDFPTVRQVWPSGNGTWNTVYAPSARRAGAAPAQIPAATPAATASDR